MPAGECGTCPLHIRGGARPTPGAADPGRCRGTRNCRSAAATRAVASRSIDPRQLSAKLRDEIRDDRGGRADFEYVADTLARIQGHRSHVALHIPAGRGHGEPGDGAALAPSDQVTDNLAVEGLCRRDR